ncbi:hypothetical protein M0804_014039 [Polistes exclamans]|nr:hypothetical protein M0804_014051 [Polistes exclamans]KAI4475864.1 hypothetical protein M0804_014039 [Polistes exclamans]
MLDYAHGEKGWLVEEEEGSAWENGRGGLGREIDGGDGGADGVGAGGRAGGGVGGGSSGGTEALRVGGWFGEANVSSATPHCRSAALTRNET